MFDKIESLRNRFSEDVDEEVEITLDETDLEENLRPNEQERILVSVD